LWLSIAIVHLMQFRYTVCWMPESLKKLIRYNISFIPGFCHTWMLSHCKNWVEAWEWGYGRNWIQSLQRLPNKTKTAQV